MAAKHWYHGKSQMAKIAYLKKHPESIYHGNPPAANRERRDALAKRAKTYAKIDATRPGTHKRAAAEDRFLRAVDNLKNTRVR